MPPSQRITIRVPTELLTALESHLRPGEALSDIVRQALQDYIRRMSDTGSVRTSDGPSDTTTPGDVLAWMTEITQRLEDLSDAVRHFVPSQPLAPPTPAPPVAYDPDAAFARMQVLQAEGRSLAQIAAQLTAEGLGTQSGQPWHKQTVWYFLQRHRR